MPAKTTALTQMDQQRTRKSLLLGMTVWFLHLNALNALTSVSCKWAFLTVPIGGLTALQLVEIVISTVALLIMLYLVYMPWRTWRSLQSEQPNANPHILQETEEDRGGMLAFLTMGLNCFFLLFVIGTFVPVLALKACGQA